MIDHAPAFGGPWTQEKLGILERYLDAYTTALKNQPFRLMYIDAFAGTGQIAPAEDAELIEARAFIDGSAARAARIDDKPFDRLLLIEKNRGRSVELGKLKAQYPGRNIVVENAEANAFLSNLNEDWRRWRGVLFLDPFGTQVKWSTIEKIAGYEAIDTWILFPVSAILRMLPTTKRPDDIDDSWVCRLTEVFGDESWRNLYRESAQQSLFGGEISYEKMQGVDGLREIYKSKLRGLFGDRYLEQSRLLMNSTNSPLFEFLFCVGSSKSTAIGAAKRIAAHILDNL